MQEDKFDDNVIKIEFLLRKVCFNIKQRGREILEDYSITPPQFDALQLLVDEGDMTVGELSVRLFLAPSTITDLVDRMEKNEHVERTRDAKDRRIVKIKAKEKGQILINEVISRRCGYIDELIKDIDVIDKSKLIDYMEILNCENKTK
jgi:MarR family transcriptional regulator, organic hydroperoxide resistance regulator